MKRLVNFLDEKINIFGFKITNFYYFFIIFMAILISVVFWGDFEYGFDLVVKEKFCGEVVKYELVDKTKGSQYHLVYVKAGEKKFKFRADGQWYRFHRYGFSKENIGDKVCVVKSYPQYLPIYEFILEIHINEKLIYSRRDAEKYYLERYKQSRYIVPILWVMIFLLLIIYFIQRINYTQNGN